MDVAALKKLYSLALFNAPGNSFKAASSVFPNDINMACRMAVEWVNDPEVLAEIERLNNPVKSIINDNIELNENVKSKEDALKLAWDIANDPLEMGKDRVAALKLFAEINNFMPDKTINKNVNMSGSVNRVMVIKDHGNDEDWELKAVRQQKALIDAE